MTGPRHLRFVEWDNPAPTGLMLATTNAADLPSLRPDDDLLLLYRPGSDLDVLSQWANAYCDRGWVVVWEEEG